MGLKRDGKEPRFILTQDERFRYTWNAENRLVCAEELYAPTNREPYVITYAYDHKGRMVRKDVALASNPSFSILHSTFVWDGWNIIRETATDLSTSQPFNFSTNYIWGLDIDGTLQGAGGVGGLLAVVRDDGVFLPTYDANGNISEYIDADDGSIVAHYDYSPFGETLIESGDQAGTFTHRFSTKPYCPVTGLCEYQMRKYRPEIGRWLNRDPIGNISASDRRVISKQKNFVNFDILNSFLSCNNNNISKFDFLGMSTCCCNGKNIECEQNFKWLGTATIGSLSVSAGTAYVQIDLKSNRTCNSCSIYKINVSGKALVLSLELPFSLTGSDMSFGNYDPDDFSGSFYYVSAGAGAMGVLEGSVMRLGNAVSASLGWVGGAELGVGSIIGQLDFRIEEETCDK